MSPVHATHLAILILAIAFATLTYALSRRGLDELLSRTVAIPGGVSFYMRLSAAPAFWSGRASGRREAGCQAGAAIYGIRLGRRRGAGRFLRLHFSDTGDISSGDHYSCGDAEAEK